MPGILKNTPLCWLNIDQIFLSPNYPDNFVWAGLTPCYAPKNCPEDASAQAYLENWVADPMAFLD